MGDERDVVEEFSAYIDGLKRRKAELDLREQSIQEKYAELTREKARLDQREKMIRTKEHPDEVLEAKLKLLEQKISEKENELRIKEAYLRGKEAELHQHVSKKVDMGIAARKDELTLEVQIEKAHTGNARLDDLFMGGVPYHSNVLAIGPAFIGKEVLMNRFLLEGIQKGIPAIVITTDVSPEEVLDEMRHAEPDIRHYFEKGYLHFIDVYSTSVGMRDETINTAYIDHPTDYNKILDAFKNISEKLKKDFGMDVMRTAVRSISTLMTYSDPTNVYKFLQTLTAKAKRGQSIAFYTIDRGMHSEPDIQTLSHLMDGAIEFKTDGVKTFLSVQGFTDVQSRAWIQYTFTKKGINIGSFAMDHIR